MEPIRGWNTLWNCMEEIRATLTRGNLTWRLQFLSSPI
jgi:hypothetical protein